MKLRMTLHFRLFCLHFPVLSLSVCTNISEVCAPYKGSLTWKTSTISEPHSPFCGHVWGGVVCLCVSAHTSLHTHMEGRSWALSTQCFKIESFIGYLPCKWFNWLASEHLGSSCVYLHLLLQARVTMSSFYMGAGDSNSGLHADTTNTLLAGHHFNTLPSSFGGVVVALCFICSRQLSTTSYTPRSPFVLWSALYCCLYNKMKN